MCAEAAVLLPVRLETRFDERAGFSGTRLRVLVVPDGCWFDRRQPASDAELDLLSRAVTGAGGPLVTGAPLSTEAAAAFDDLAARVGPGRALWLARTFPAMSEGGGWTVDRGAGPVRGTGAQGTRIHGIPAGLELHALLDNGPDQQPPDVPPEPVLLATSEPKPGFTIGPSPEDPDGWWPSWRALRKVGLTFIVDLGDTPAGLIEPDRIAVLFVVGLGDTEALEIFRAHLAPGDLGLLRPGVPTNTVTGAPAADLGREPEAWRGLAARGVNAEEREVGVAITGAEDVIGPLVGSSPEPVGQVAEVLVPLLWPALGAHVLREVWNLVGDDSVDLAGEWAAAYLRPDGPLPSLRIRDQPYGLWPVSDWARWDPSDGTSQALAGEAKVPAAAEACRVIAERARTGLGTVVGAEAVRLWEIVAQTPTSTGYEVRPAIRLHTLARFMDASTQEATERWWYEHVLAITDPLTRAGEINAVITLGGPLPLHLSLVLPGVAYGADGQPLFMTRPRGVAPEEVEDWLTNRPGIWLADACRFLHELFAEGGLRRDLWETMTAEMGWWPTSLLWRLMVVSGLLSLDEAHRVAANSGFGTYDPDLPLGQRVQDPIAADGRGLAFEAYQRFRAALERLEALAGNSGGGPFLADVDRVLCGLLDTASHRFDPWLTGAAWRRLRSLPGPRPVGLYGWVDRPHTGQPGPDADAGVLLAPSDGQARTAVVLRDKGVSDPDSRWHLDLTSARVRDAVRLSDDVRAGAHPSEALGREVERVVGERRKVDELRAVFPVREEHAGRRTCDGIAVLAAATAIPPDQRLVDAGLDGSDIDSVAAVAATVDAYADLLVAGAVHHALAGRPEVAAQAIEAAAGLGAPPPLDVLATPRRGRSLRTTVLATFPAVPAAPTDERSPAVIACPAVAGWLAEATGDPAGSAWTWTVRSDAGMVSVTLAGLGLVPADVLVVHPGVLDDLAAATAGAGPGAEVTPPTGPDDVRRLSAALAARPLSGQDLGLDDAAAAAFDVPGRNELIGRLEALREAAKGLAERLRAAGTDPDRATLLSEVLRWGLAPNGEDLAAWAAQAAGTLDDRVAASPAPPIDKGVSLVELARAVTDLAGLGASIPMLVSASVGLLADTVGVLAAEPVGAGGRPRLDETWLEVVAAVRSPLARLEAHQIMAANLDLPILAAATTHPDDPWLQEVPAPAPTDPNVPHIVVAYGPHPLPASGSVAVGVLDGWAEVVPDERHTASAAFKFNAPGSRAPQALLLAVTPVPGEGLSIGGVLSTVAQARTVAHARMARPEDIGMFDVLAGGLLPAFEYGGFQHAVPATWDDWP